MFLMNIVDLVSYTSELYTNVFKTATNKGRAYSFSPTNKHWLLSLIFSARYLGTYLIRTA